MNKLIKAGANENIRDNYGNKPSKLNPGTRAQSALVAPAALVAHWLDRVASGLGRVVSWQDYLCKAAGTAGAAGE